ncbi:DUF6048 family protein [Flavobacterium sp.]|uniref:DUF6048 family protein n=1 Tax=Flavobacterium sp. TaxID=239 RepID=UPI0025C56E99|nr:DUF6048 family protein [Flavobacterium sp.]
MKHISKSIFSIILIISVSLTALSQDKKQKSDTIQIPQRYGLRLGLDLHRITKSFYDKNYRGLEIVGDYRLTKKIYVACELGNEEKTKQDDQLNYSTKGTYFKVGFDFNAYENWLDMENMIYIGLRAGFSSFSQTLNTYNIYEPKSFYGISTLDSGQKWNGLSASWIEVVSGLKAEVFNNVYIGFSVRLNYLLSNKEPEGFANLHIPGFNKTYENSKFGAGFNYTISYFIPLYKSRK